MNIPYDQPLLVILALLTAVLGAGRLVRVLTVDSFPPAVWLRTRWDVLTKDGEWSILAHCLWCLTPWVMAGCIAWGYFSSLHWTWWFFWGWLALSYVASMIIVRDDPHDYDD